MEYFDSFLNSGSVLCVLIAIYVLTYLVRPKKRYAPGPWGFPILGHLPLFGQHPTETFMKWRKRFGDVYRIRLGSWNTVVLNGYDTVKEALERSDDVFSGRPDFISTKITKEYRGGVESVEFGPFDVAYLKQRKLTAFALRKFINVRDGYFEDIIKDEAEKLISYFLSKNEKPNSAEDAVSFAVASINYQVLFGKGQDANEDADLKEMIQIQEAFVEFVGSSNVSDVLPWLRFIFPEKLKQLLKFVNLSDSIIDRKVNEHKDTFSSSDLRGVTDVFIDAKLPVVVMDETNEVSEKRQMLTLGDLLGAGFGTLSRTMHWMILYMIAYPEVQHTIQMEIDDKVGRGRSVDFSDRSNLHYTQATIREVMRINPVASAALPHLATNDTSINGFDIDKGTVIIANLKSANHDETIWENPESFKPERHLDARGCLKKRSPIAFFGFGRRKCIGEYMAKLELFLLFAILIQRCTLQKPNGDVINMEPVEKLLSSPKPYRVIVKLRN